MTSEEARVLLKGLFLMVKNPTMREAVSVAQLANEKQIAKKPKEKCIYGGICIDWICPICGRFHRNDYVLEYCSACGQRIDWSEV